MMKIKVLNAETLGKINEINLDLVTNGNREYVVGRSSKSGLILDSNDVSRQHGKFYLLNGNYYYSDLASINGSLVNNQLVECDRSYLLKAGDIVRIGEFLLVLEEEVEEPEIAATVYNANIDWRTALNISLPEVTNQVTEDVNTSSSAEQTADAEILLNSDDNQVLDSTILQEKEESEQQQKSEVENQVSLDSEHSLELTNQLSQAEDEDGEQQQNLLVENQANLDDEPSSELTTVQSEQTTIQTLEAENEEFEQFPQEANQLNLDDEPSSELTTIQTLEAENEEFEQFSQEANQLTLDDKHSSELTTVQALEIEVPQKAAELDNQLNLDDEFNHELTTVQTLPTEDEQSEQEDSEINTSSDNNGFSKMGIISSVETINEQSLDDKIPEEEEVIDNSDNLQADSEDIGTITETIGQVSEESEQVADLETDTTEVVEEAEEANIASQTPEATSKAFEIISKKYIALMAHDSTKSELVDFVAQHQEFLAKCLTIATPTISDILFQETGLVISQKTPSVPVGGYQGVASLVGTGEALAVILLKDFLVPQTNQANEDALLRLCNINQVLVATNVSTAEAIVHYIKDMVSSL